MAATSTYMTFLMHLNSSTWEKLIDIVNVPDLGGSPELIDVTTLSHGQRVYIPGIQENEGLEYSVLYDHDDYEALKALKGSEETYAVWLGGTENESSLPTPTGSYGKFSFTGYLDVYINGGEVNEARKMTIVIAPTSEISDVTDS